MQLRLRSVGGMLLALVLLPSTAAFADSIVLYGGNGAGSGLTAGNLVTVDQTTGAGTFVGDPVTPGGISGLAFASSTLLYGSTIAGFGSTSSLIVIDPVTGALVGLPLPILDGATPISIGDLAIDPSGTLFGIRSNTDLGGGGGYLYTIDTSTGAATFVGDTDAGAGGGIAFASGGTLYQTSYNSNFDFFSLNVLDPTDASRVSTIPIDFFFDGLAVRETDGVLFAALGGFDGISTIDPNTGTTYFLGATGTGKVSDLAFRPGEDVVVPEPAGGMLLGLGLGAIAIWRRFRG